MHNWHPKPLVATAGKTHIFFGVGEKWGSHQSPPQDPVSDRSLTYKIG